MRLLGAPGSRAIATTSAGVAAALGYQDGERIPAQEISSPSCSASASRGSAWGSALARVALAAARDAAGELRADGRFDALAGAMASSELARLLEH